MKIALLSFHNAANYGASLQAYALQKFLTDCGYDCEYINYVNTSRAHEYSMTWHIYDSLIHGNIKSAIAYFLGSPFMTLRKWRFDGFYKTHLLKTKRVFHSLKEAEELNDQYDFFIVGSDQVWNPQCNGDDAAFLLAFVKDNRKRISYSPSFGTTTIDESQKEIFKANLQKFAHIGVRESLGQKIVFELAGRDAKLCIDPVLLLTKEQWQGIMPKKVSNEQYIFSYTNRDAQIIDFFKTGYKLNGKKHYLLSRYTKPSDFINNQIRVKYCMSPQEFLWVLDHAELIVSASFHCIAMSIVLNKQFVAILVGDEGKDDRLVTLLKNLDLEDRILRKESTLAEVNKRIDWDNVNKKLAVLREDSIQYLMDAIRI